MGVAQQCMLGRLVMFNYLQPDESKNETSIILNLCFFSFLAAPYSMWVLISPTRHQTCALWSGSMES